MNKAIYPYKFVPEAKTRVWGGNRLAMNYNKPFDPKETIGESWEISGFEEDSSKIAEGYMEGNPLFDVIETYMDEIVGDDNYKRFGNEFPILVKVLDINDRLSVQVHPDDETAFDRHNSYGKNEAWYVLDAEPDAKVYMGFKRDITAQEFLDKCTSGKLDEVLNVYTPKKGDFFFIEAGTVHAAGGGLVIAEVQQLSDVTYRIYDWGREHNPATARQMHVEEALSVIDFKKYREEGHYWKAEEAQVRRLVSNKYFTVTEFDLQDAMHIYTDRYESFILYAGIEGEAVIAPSGTDEKYTLKKGEWILIPAAMKDFIISGAVPGTKVLETYIAKEEDHDTYVEDEHEGHEHNHDCDCGHHHEHHS